jgi:molecular chaperone Hsp33
MITPELQDPVQIKRLAGLAPDGLSIFTLEGDAIRGALVSATRMLSLMAQAHALGSLETLLLGKAYIAAALLSITIKGNDRLTLRVEGDGPAQGYSAECNARGQVRGRLFSSSIDLASLPANFDSGALIGQGQVSITRFMEGRSDPVSGTCGAKTGRLAEDLAYYFHMSEQLRTSFTLSVHFDADGRVAGAGGLFLQALPFAKAEALDRVERLVYGLPSLGETFASGASRMDVALRSFPFFDLNLMDERPAEFRCPCERERLRSFLGALPADELADLAANGPFPVELKCHNCGSAYHFSRQDVLALAKRRGL